MTSPDLIHALKASRPAAPIALRSRIREIATQDAAPATASWPTLRLRLPVRRTAMVAMPAAAALAIATAGAVGLARSDESYEALRDSIGITKSTPEATPSVTTNLGAPPQDSAIGPTRDRAQRVSATLTVEVPDSDGVSGAAQAALDLTRRLGGHVVSASVATGEEGSAALVLRVPVARVQEAIVQLSGLGRIVSQQVQIDDLQEGLDRLESRERSVRAQIALVAARLDTESLDATTRAQLETRLQNLRGELRELRRGISATNAEARMATIQLTVVTPGMLGAVPVPSRLDRTLDEALDVLVWEGVIVIAIAIVAAPFALVAFAAWLGRKLYRRREEDRLLAT
ncbi:MAG: DUF4349 domain-containing protein [Gaiellaceae bacterium]